MSLSSISLVEEYRRSILRAQDKVTAHALRMASGCQALTQSTPEFEYLLKRLNVICHILS
jgi:hypothetical protein